MILVIHKFRENILESLQNVSETPHIPTCWCLLQGNLSKKTASQIGLKWQVVYYESK